MEIMNMNKEITNPYLIESSYRLPSTIGKVIEDSIIKVSGEYNGTPKHKEIWLKHTRILLAHVFTCSLNRNKDDAKWIVFPIANKELQKKIRHALSTKIKHKRGLDVLVKLNIIEIKPHNIERHKCTRLKISEQVYSLVKEFLLNSEFESRRFYQINGKSNLFKDIKKKGKKDLIKRVEDVLSNLSKELNNYYKESLNKLAPVRVNIDALIEYIKDMRKTIANDRELESNIIRIWQAEATLLNILGDYKLISNNPFIVEYYPKYKVAVTGGRLFEVDNGVQNLPHKLKEKSLIGYNYDLVSSQLNIVKFYATKYLGYSDIGFESVDDIASRLDINREYAKKVLYGTLFNAGIVSTSPENTVFKKLSSFYGQEKAKKVLIEWKDIGEKFISIIKKLCKVFKTSDDFVITKKNGNKYLKNDVGILLDLSKIDEKQILSHIIQGLESSYLLKVINMNEGQISALEHDGFVTQLKNVRAPEIDYLKLTEKSSYFPTQESHDHSDFELSKKHFNK